MSRKISSFISVLLLTLFSIPLTTVFAESSLDFEIIPMHYGLLNAEPMTLNENSLLTGFTLLHSANKGDTQITLTGSNHLNPSELFVYISTSDTYYVAQVKTVTNNVIELMKPLEEAVNAGSNIWNFYNDAFHPNFYGFTALGDYALDCLKEENLANKVHAFIGDSWFDNDMLVPRLESKLNASQIINKGVGGRRSADVLNTFDEEFPAGAASQPDYFWVFLGTNDWDNDIPASEYIGNLKQIIKKINARGAKAIVFTSSVGPISLSYGSTPMLKVLSNKYADDLLALKQSGESSISVTLKNDDLIIEFNANHSLNTNSHYMFFIDIDNEANTGYRYSELWENSGLDYMVQDGFLYKSLANDWNWVQIGAVETIGLNKVKIKKSDLNFNKSTNPIIRIGASIISNDWITTEDHFPKTSEMKKVDLNKITLPIDTKELKVTVKNNNLVIEYKSIAAFTNNSHFLVFIDSDNNADTGYNSILWSSSGADYLVQNNFVYKSQSNDSNWKWQDQNSVVSFERNKVVVSLNDLGLANLTSDKVIKLGVLIASNDWSTKESYPKSGNMQQVTINGSYEWQLKALKDIVLTKAGMPITIDVLANDIGTGLTIDMFETPNNGSASISNSQIIYAPNAGFSGLDKFRYKVMDSSGQSAWGEIEIIVRPIKNDTLKAKKDTATVKSGETVLIDVLANDIGTGLSIDMSETPNNGSASISNNQLVYTPNVGFSGVEKFKYKIVDSLGQNAWGEIEVTVTPKNNDTLKANKDTATVKSGGTVLIDVLANDTGSALELSCVDYAWSGATSLVGGKVKYTSDGSYIGKVTFWYDVADEFGDRTWASVTVTITK